MVGQSLRYPQRRTCTPEPSPVPIYLEYEDEKGEEREKNCTRQEEMSLYDEEIAVSGSDAEKPQLVKNIEPHLSLSSASLRVEKGYLDICAHALQIYCALAKLRPPVLSVSRVRDKNKPQMWIFKCQYIVKMSHGMKSESIHSYGTSIYKNYARNYAALYLLFKIFPNFEKDYKKILLHIDDMMKNSELHMKPLFIGAKDNPEPNCSIERMKDSMSLLHEACLALCYQVTSQITYHSGSHHCIVSVETDKGVFFGESASSCRKNAKLEACTQVLFLIFPNCFNIGQIVETVMILRGKFHPFARTFHTGERFTTKAQISHVDSPSSHPPPPHYYPDVNCHSHLLHPSRYHPQFHYFPPSTKTNYIMSGALPMMNHYPSRDLLYPQDVLSYAVTYQYGEIPHINRYTAQHGIDHREDDNNNNNNYKDFKEKTQTLNKEN